MVHIEPGTYRIINVASGTAMAIPENNIWDVVCWERNDNKNQKWFAQRSGEGYRFKNCQFGHYLAISETRVCAPVYAAWYPTSWQLIQNKEDNNMYIMKSGDVDLVIDLDNYGAAHNGNHLHTYAQEHWVPQKRWRLERLSDDTGEEEGRLKKEVAAKNQELVGKDKLVADLTKQLSNKDRELARVRKELAEMSTLLEQTQSALRQATEPNIKQSRMGDELAQQQKETATLRDKMERFERLFSQMNVEPRRPNNIA